METSIVHLSDFGRWNFASGKLEASHWFGDSDIWLADGTKQITLPLPPHVQC